VSPGFSIAREDSGSWRRHPGRQERASGSLSAPADAPIEVTRRFEPEGEVHCVETPAGEAIVGVHQGAYGGLPKAHAALHAWCAANGRALDAHSLEVYGDWSDEPSKLETTIQYLLR
jgi:effector-binding domain-containing protein